MGFILHMVSSTTKVFLLDKPFHDNTTSSVWNLNSHLPWKFGTLNKACFSTNCISTLFRVPLYIDSFHPPPVSTTRSAPPSLTAVSAHKFFSNHLILRSSTTVFNCIYQQKTRLEKRCKHANLVRGQFLPKMLTFWIIIMWTNNIPKCNELYNFCITLSHITWEILVRKHFRYFLMSAKDIYNVNYTYNTIQSW